MITVRFPTGVAVQYNEATYAQGWGADMVKLSVGEDGKTVAIVPKNAIIEWHKPCRIYNGVHEPGEIVEALNAMIGDKDQRARLPRYELAQLKSRLKSFNARGKFWSS